MKISRSFWEFGPALQSSLRSRGMVYSFYVDDIAVYSLTFMDNAAKTEVIADTYGMLFKHGYPQFVNRGSARDFRIYVIDH
ncbi:hypothetical protein [Pantoea agglomerans]|uniref:hypothetical protein n=1 Tax=Enterobacter agglomerans TaxID=549 RepID=UPI000E0563E6|nr:hypothetical protein [Pantoea agglomerans]SUC48632.1 Uncharacterised protein [Pantoea agglomerans]